MLKPSNTNAERIRWLGRITHCLIRFGFSGLGVPLTKNEKRISAFRNKYRGQRCFIVGNGPSLLKTNLDLLKDEISFAANAIYLYFPKTSFRPTFWSIEDELVAEDRADEIQTLSGFTKFVSTHCWRWIKPQKDNVYIHQAKRYPFLPMFSKRLEWIAWGGHSVTYMNIQLAFHMGFKEVYLVGMDHSYRFPTEKDQMVGRRILSQTQDVNHFDPNYFGPGFRWHEPKMDDITKSYQLARQVFEKDGRSIFNATVGGKLEVFPRVQLEDVLSTGPTENSTSG